MSTTAQRHCTPCERGAKPLQSEALEKYVDQLGEDWAVVDGKRLQKEFHFNDFKETWAFVDLVAELAEEENHHPNIEFTWGRATITLWTHKIDGLHENDFIMAARIDEL